MKNKQCTVQIGKNGINGNFVEAITNAFKNHENVRVCVLKSGRHDKKRVKEVAGELVQMLGDHYTAKTLGFTIFVKKWRRAVSR
ncbi:MAG: YhbY family RNA-binding protein [Nanoarchaeota archaeon]